MKTIDPRQMERGDVHDLFVSIIVPRPIALISTVGENGVNNIAPYSTLAWCCFKPPLVSIVSASAPDGRAQDTLRNVEFTKDFVVNMTTERLVESMIKTSEFETRRDANYKVVANPIDISKLEAIGILRGRTYCRTTRDTFELALIYGAGIGGQLALKEIETNRDLRLRLVGFIDDEPSLKSQIIQGYPVFGGYEEMEKIIRMYRTTKIIVAFKENAAEKIKIIKALCHKIGVEVDVEQSLS